MLKNKTQSISKKISLSSIGKFIIQMFEFIKLKYLSRVAMPYKMDRKITLQYLSSVPFILMPLELFLKTCL